MSGNSCCIQRYNLKRHHQTKHGEFAREMSQEERRKKSAEYVKKLEKQQAVFKETIGSSEQCYTGKFHGSVQPC